MKFRHGACHNPHETKKGGNSKCAKRQPFKPQCHKPAQPTTPAPAPVTPAPATPAQPSPIVVGEVAENPF